MKNSSTVCALHSLGSLTCPILKAWLQFKAVIRESAIFVMRELRLQALNKAALLTKAIGVFRSLRSGAASFGSALHSLRNETSLHAAVLADSKSSTVHLKHVQGVISSVYKSHPPVVSPKTQSFLKSAKNSLPGESKSLLTHLFEDCKKIDDSVSMARVLQRKWSPVWNKKHPAPNTVFRYLDRYSKHIGTISPITLPLESLGLFTTTDQGYWSFFAL